MVGVPTDFSLAALFSEIPEKKTITLKILRLKEALG